MQYYQKSNKTRVLLMITHIQINCNHISYFSSILDCLLHINNFMDRHLLYDEFPEKSKSVKKVTDVLDIKHYINMIMSG